MQNSILPHPELALRGSEAHVEGRKTVLEASTETPLKMDHLGRGEVYVTDNENGSSRVSLRLPDEVIEAIDKLGGILERSRSWVMLRALQHYLDDEGIELAAHAESLAQLDHGETTPFHKAIDEVERIIRKRARRRNIRR